MSLPFENSRRKQNLFKLLLNIVNTLQSLLATGMEIWWAILRLSRAGVFADTHDIIGLIR